MKTIFSAPNKTVGVNGGASKAGVSPLPANVVTKVPAQPLMTMQQANLANKIKGAAKPKV
jgi:hypothetical protein